ncbi:malto-oligosyltrehalose trehalohydrolase, partial [Microbacterium sp. SUBG005]
MGEEYGETNPFLFFTDFHGDLAKACGKGGQKSLPATADMMAMYRIRMTSMTFARSKLDWHNVTTAQGKSWLRFTRSLLVLRHRYLVPLLRPGGTVEGKIVKTAPGMVAVSWSFPTGTLSLALNIGNKPVDAPALAGETLFSWP